MYLLNRSVTTKHLRNKFASQVLKQSVPYPKPESINTTLSLNLNYYSNRKSLIIKSAVAASFLKIRLVIFERSKFCADIPWSVTQ